MSTIRTRKTHPLTGGAPETKLVWNRERLAALLGFMIGVMVAILIVMAIDLIPDPTICTYHAPLLPVEGCKFVMKGNG